MSPAIATELPKEGTCRYAMKVDGKQTVDELNVAKNDGIAYWDETETPGDKDCGQTQWPPMKPSHCYGFSELDGKLAFSTGYCVEADEDGDKIIWKMDPTKDNQYASALNGTSQILMGGGKYTGISGKSKWHCTYGGSFTKYAGRCDIEETLKFPGKE
ncbi:MAG: hypothetical protein WBQ45_22565 [Roseiarcus sp.]